MVSQALYTGLIALIALQRISELLLSRRNRAWALERGALEFGARQLPPIKLLHTAVWAMLVAVIIAIPVLAWQNRFVWVAILTAVMLVEVAVLAVNGMRCPLTDLAARFTDDRRANFDIYLPLWLAANNKRIFGSVFVAGLVVAAVRWLGR